MRRPFVLSACLIITLLCISACSVTGIGLSIVNGLAKKGDYLLTPSVSYGPSPDNRLDIYRPALSDQTDKKTANGQKLPVVVFFYGGCWGACSSLNKDNYRFVAEAITSEQYITVVTDYRGYPEVRFPAIMDDARSAVEWVRNNISDYNGDPERIFLMGHSAGAQLAAMLTLNESYLTPDTYRRIRGFIGLAGPYDFLPLTRSYQRFVFGPEENYAASQPVNFVSGNEPAIKLMHGLDDRIVKQKNSKNLTAKVKAMGGEIETTYYEGVDHTDILAALSIPLRKHSTITSDIVDFLNRKSAL